MKDTVATAPTENKKSAPDQYEIDNWVRTVIEAQEIKDDAKKWKYVRPHLEKKAKAAVKTMDELRARAKDVDDESPDTDD